MRRPAMNETNSTPASGKRERAVDRERDDDRHHVSDRLGPHAPGPGHAVAEDHEGRPGQQERQTEIVQQAEAAPEGGSDQREAEQGRYAIAQGSARIAETGERSREGDEEQRRRLHARCSPRARRRTRRPPVKPSATLMLPRSSPIRELAADLRRELGAFPDGAMAASAVVSHEARAKPGHRQRSAGWSGDQSGRNAARTPRPQDRTETAAGHHVADEVEVGAVRARPPRGSRGPAGRDASAATVPKAPRRGP